MSVLDPLPTSPRAPAGHLRSWRSGVVQTTRRSAGVFRLANPAPFDELQQRFVREYTDTLVELAPVVRAIRHR